MDVKLLTGFYFKFLSLKVGCTGLSECTLVKMPHCWKSHVTAQMVIVAEGILCDMLNLQEIDLLASRLKNKRPVYCSYHPDMFASHVDVFSLDWGYWGYFKCHIYFPFQSGGMMLAADSGGQSQVHSDNPFMDNTDLVFCINEDFNPQANSASKNGENSDPPFHIWM